MAWISSCWLGDFSSSSNLIFFPSSGSSLSVKLLAWQAIAIREDLLGGTLYKLCQGFPCIFICLTFLQTLGSIPVGPQMILDYNSQNSWHAHLVVRVSGNFSVRISEDPKASNHCSRARTGSAALQMLLNCWSQHSSLMAMLSGNDGNYSPKTSRRLHFAQQGRNVQLLAKGGAEQF